MLERRWFHNLTSFQVEVAKAKRLFTSFRTNTQHGGVICNPNQKKIKKFLGDQYSYLW